MRQQAAAARQAPQDSDGVYLFPRWWFAFMKLGSVPNSILEGCLWAVIWPQAISDTFGDGEKTKVLGLLQSVTVAVQLLSPLVGDMADNLPPRYSRFCGRRRPFVLLGHGLYMGGLLCSYFGLYGKRLELMLFGSVLSGLTLMLQTPNYAALVSETVAPQQRGTMATIQQQIASICRMLASVLGILVGEGALRRWLPHSWGGDHVVWFALFGCKVLMTPLLYVNARHAAPAATTFS